MKRTNSSIVSAVFIVVVLVVVYVGLMPRWNISGNVPLNEFSTDRAMRHVAQMAQQPHYVGSDNHKTVASYIENELVALGLKVEFQEGTTLTDWGNLVKSRNIVARIEGTGNGKALVLLSHYDSAPHSASKGAADDASGVAVILESVRTFIHNKTKHTNDIIIVFTDAEELGLNGAALFVTKHQFAKNVGMVLNFEARGTAGPGYMLLEVNNGNSKLVDAFAAASPEYPVSNSLMYSIYKMLPNDTDLTVFRTEGKIQGMNFAFIDDHFNYHTAQDDITHLSAASVAHQGSYLMPLLGHLSTADLSNLTTDDDQVYFNAPFTFFHYSFDWIFPMLTIAFVLFLLLLFIGFGKRILNGREIGKGFILMLGTLLVSGVVGFLGWKAVLMIYPEYREILQGFTYNGHYYIAAFVSLAPAIAFLFYRNSSANINHMVAPLVLWLLINLGVAVFLSGASFFIIPVYFALAMFGISIITQRNQTIAFLFLGIPALVLIAPFIFMFPIGLGLKLLFGSMILTVLLFTLLLPIFSSFQRKPVWSVFFFLVSAASIIYAQIESGYSAGKARPNSLLYVYNADTDKAVWTTYDLKLDDWTQTYLTDKPAQAKALSDLNLFSKYNTTFTFESQALVRALPEPEIQFLRDSTTGGYRHLVIQIKPRRRVNRIDLFADEKMIIHNFRANGTTALGQQGSLYPRNGKKLLSYYVVDNEPLEISFSIAAQSILDMELLEASFDLANHPLFEMKKRTNAMMPTPFVLNDAIVVRKKIRPTNFETILIPVQKDFRPQNRIINDTIADPDENSVIELEE